MRLQFVASFSFWIDEVAQIPIRSVRITEEIAHKLGGGRHELVSRRTEYRQRTIAVFKPGRKDQSREVAAVIDMKMAEQKDVHLRHLRSTLPKPKSATASCVNDHTRLTVLPYQIAGRRSLILRLRATRAEYLHRHTCSAA